MVVAFAYGCSLSSPVDRKRAAQRPSCPRQLREPSQLSHKTNSHEDEMSREERKLHKAVEKHASREQQKLNQQLNRQRKAGLRKPPRPHIGADVDFDELEIAEPPRRTAVE